MSDANLPSVAGRMTMTHESFQRACLVALDHILHEPIPETALISLFCEAVRCSRECCEIAGGSESKAKIDDLKSEAERLKVELKEAQAAAAVMREALESCAKHFEEMEDVAWNDDSDVTSETFMESQKSVQAALATTAGTAFLARMAEAEWLVGNASVSAYIRPDWWQRRDAFLNGEPV